MDRATRRRQARDDQRLLTNGIDPKSGTPDQTAAMARRLYSLLQQSRENSDLEPVVDYLHSKVEQTTHHLRNVPVACKKGCSHCCHIWVSATAPEILLVARLIRSRGESAIAAVKTAHNYTKDFSYEVRPLHPNPCPMLQNNQCSIYEQRPSVCRLVVSSDADICARSYLNNEIKDVPMPTVYLAGRSDYAIALAAALRHASYPHTSYEFNAGLTRALESESSEKDWIAGKDIFADIRRDPLDIFSQTQARRLYEYAFA